MNITFKDWDSINTFKLSSHVQNELKEIKEQALEVETEFYNILFKEMKIDFLGNKGKKNAFYGAGEGILGRELGKKLAEFTGNQMAKEIFCQEANKLKGMQEP